MLRYSTRMFAVAGVFEKEAALLLANALPLANEVMSAAPGAGGLFVQRKVANMSSDFLLET